MTAGTTILVPVRYPLTEASARTLAAARQVATDRAPADLQVLHVNLFQNNEKIQAGELSRALRSSALEGVDMSVMTRQGFLVEEVILDEAREIGADVVVVGENRKAAWRRFLSRIVGNTPDVGGFLQQQLGQSVEIREVDPTVDPVSASA